MNVTSSPSRERRSLAPIPIAILVAAFAFLPIANWIPGGHAARWYGVVAKVWLTGSSIAVGVGILGALLSRHIPALWRDRALDPVVARWRDNPRAASLAISATALIAYVTVALVVFGGHPLFVDEITQLIQAQIFAHGELWRAAPPHPEFFSSLLVANAHGRIFSQFPAGGPAMLLPGVLVGAPWIAGPLWGAVAVFAFAAFIRVAEPRPGVALAATVVFAFAPFALFMSGTFMNHVPTLAWIAIAMAAMAQLMTSDAPRPGLAFLNGLALGAAATIRPADALAFAAPAGVWYVARAIRTPRRLVDVVAAGVGVAIPLALLFWVNAQTTGHPLLFGYELLWGKSHALGFHSAPWGVVHTPARGVELVSIYFLQLQTYLFESPLPSLLPVIVALVLTRSFLAFDRYLLASAALLVGLYFAYWHEGFYLGPRFMYPLLPVLAIYCARALPLLRDRFGSGAPYRAAVYATICAVATAAISLVPLRARSYRHSMLTMQWDADAAARSARVRHAVVLVRTSWGSQIVARLWALGIPRGEVERIYRSVDACVLESRLDSLDRARATTVSPHSFESLFADSARLIGSPLTPDSTERLLPGMAYSPRCIAHIAEDRAGFTLLGPLLLAHGGDDIYAHDLGARDSLLLSEYPSRPVYLLRPASARIGDPPRFEPLDRDSLLRAWRSDTVASPARAGR